MHSRIVSLVVLLICAISLMLMLQTCANRCKQSEYFADPSTVAPSTTPAPDGNTKCKYGDYGTVNDVCKPLKTACQASDGTMFYVDGPCSDVKSSAITNTNPCLKDLKKTFPLPGWDYYYIWTETPLAPTDLSLDSVKAYDCLAKTCPNELNSIKQGNSRASQVFLSKQWDGQCNTLSKYNCKNHEELPAAKICKWT